jgi:hypothetical protein
MTEPSSPARPRSLYFVNAPVDFALVGGASILFYLALWAMQKTQSDPRFFPVATVLMWVVNWPHFSATNYRLYHSKANIAQYPVTAIAIPVLILAAVIVSFHSPERVAPFFVKFFLIWSPYHFTAQSLGITLIYARRAGFAVGGVDRLALSGFVYGTFAASVARSEVPSRTRSYYDLQIPSLGVPQEFADVLIYGMYLSGAVFLLRVAMWCVRERRLLPPIILLPALTQFVWFIPGNKSPNFNLFVPFFHSLQYLLIAWAMQLKERLDESGAAPSGRFVLRESLIWGAANFAGGFGLFYLLPRLGAGFGYRPGFAEAIVVSAVQIHHFFVDGVIWKLRNPKVGAPLLVNLKDLLRPAPAGAVPSSA